MTLDRSQADAEAFCSSSAVSPLLVEYREQNLSNGVLERLLERNLDAARVRCTSFERRPAVQRRGQVHQPNDLVRPEQAKTFHGVAQLTHVARPVVVLEGRHDRL